jgi:hypothetical protein
MKDYEIKMVSAEQFKPLSRNLYRKTFGKEYPKQEDRIDFACIFYHKGNPSGYATCYEHNSEVLYLQFGGSFPEYRNTRIVFVSYNMLIKRLLEKYHFLTTKVESENIPMLKMAFKCGWKINGTYLDSDKKLLVELVNRRTQSIYSDCNGNSMAVIARDVDGGNADRGNGAQPGESSFVQASKRYTAIAVSGNAYGSVSP